MRKGVIINVIEQFAIRHCLPYLQTTGRPYAPTNIVSAAKVIDRQAIVINDDGQPSHLWWTGGN